MDNFFASALSREFGRRQLRLLTTILPMLATTSLAAVDITPSPEVVELPKLNVTSVRESLPPPEKWRYTNIPGVEVLTNASDRETSQLLRDFQIFQVAIANFKKWPLETKTLPPITFILCGRANAFDEFNPGGQPTDAGESNHVSVTYANSERAFIVVDLQRKTISLNPDATTDGDGNTAFATTDFEVDHYKMLYRAYVRYLLSKSTNGEAPLWLNEGITRILTAVKIDDRSLIFGQIQPTNLITAEQESANAANAAAAAAGDTTSRALSGTGTSGDFNGALQKTRLLEFNEFFGYTRDSEAAKDSTTSATWANQAYAFVHFCLYDMGQKYRKSLDKLVARTAKEPLTEKLFEECFGLTYHKFLSDLRGHINFTAYKYDELTLKGGAKFDFPKPAFRDAPEAQSAVIKAEALRLARKPGVARAGLAVAYARGDRDPQLLASLGILELIDGDKARARQFLEAAIAGKTTRADAYVRLASLRFEEASAHPAGTKGKINPTQLASILQPLFAARVLPPLYPEIYELIAAAWLNSDTAPKTENLNVLTEGLKNFPGNHRLVFSTAVLNARIKNFAAARGLIEYGLKITRDEEVRQRFEILKTTLPPPPSVEAATPPAKK